MSDAPVVALLLSLKIAFWATVIVLPPGILMGYLLARWRFPGRSLVETLIMLPLVLPPTAVGYALLRLLARDGPLGPDRIGFDLDLILTWKGAVMAACVMSLPLVARTARVAFHEVNPRFEAMARTLGAGALRTFFGVTLPLARRGVLAAAILGFSRALGEFGATVIVAGSIPGQTQTLALAIYNDIQTGHDGDAMQLLGITVVLAFAAVWCVEVLMHRGAPGSRERQSGET